MADGEGVAPIGHLKPITVYMDRTLLDHSEVWAAAGRPDSVFRVDPQALATLLHLPDDIEIYQVVKGKRQRLPRTSSVTMVFLPGALLLAAALPFWAGLRANHTARAALTGVNAAVVGILAAALYTPVATTAIHDWTDIAIALMAFLALQVLRWPAWVVVPIGAGFGLAFAAFV